MNRDDALKKCEDALQELAEALQQGRSEQLVEYLNTLSRFHRYSFGNCLLIALQRPDATRVAGFNRWKQLERRVKKGEKGIAILAPIVSRRKQIDVEIPEDEPLEGQPSKTVRGFRIAHVFDVTQTDGKELPSFSSPSGDPGEKIDRLVSIIVGKGIAVHFVDVLPGGANGCSLGGEVMVVSSLPAAQKFSTLAHELAHELLHRGDRRESTTKVVRETEAEAVAYVVSRTAGLECSTRASDYIQLWNGNAQLLMQSLDLIRDVAADILRELEQSDAVASAETEVTDAI